MNRPQLRLISAAIVAHFTLVAPTLALELPKVQFVKGEVKVLKVDGSTVDLKKGDVVKPGEKLITGGGGIAQIKTPDQGVVALRKNTEIEFKPVGDKFDVALNHGQLRTVNALGLNQSPRELKVLTPDSTIAVKNGDSETGVTVGNGGQTTSHARLGEVNVQGKNGDLLTLAPGQAMAGAGDAPLKALSEPVPMPAAVEPPETAGSPEVDNTSLVALNAPATPIAPPVAGGANNLGQGLLKTPVAGSQIPNSNMNGGPKIPETRVNVAILDAPGVDPSVNQILNNVIVLEAGKPGVSDSKTLTVTDPSKLSSQIKTNSVVSLTPTSVQVAGSSIDALTPVGGAKFSNTVQGASVKTDSLALAQPIATSVGSGNFTGSLASVIAASSTNTSFTALDVSKVTDLTSTTKASLITAPTLITNANIATTTPVLAATPVTTVSTITPTPVVTTTTPVVTNITTTAPLITTTTNNQTLVSGIVSLKSSGFTLSKLK